MRNDDHVIFENYWARYTGPAKPKASKRPTSNHGMPVDPSITGSKFGMETSPKGYDALQNFLDKKLAQKPGSTPKRAEDAESDNTAVKELHDVVNILQKHYHTGKDLDNDTLGDIVSEFQDILAVGFGSPSEDAEEHCEYAKEGCDCNKCSECKDNKEENAESSADDIMAKIEAKRKARRNIGSVRAEDAEEYSDELFGSINDWGDSYEPLKRAINNCIKHGFNVNILLDILRHAEEFGYVGDSLSKDYLQPFTRTKCYKDLEFAVKEFYERGLQDS